MKAKQNLLALFRAKIAISGKLKKDLARECNLAPPYFSEMLWGDREMPQDVVQHLITALNVNPSSELPIVEKLM
jgi:hypothetical protein